MGLAHIFSDSADFSGITTAQPLRISKVIQKVYIEVREEGTEAAAVSGTKLSILLTTVASAPQFHLWDELLTIENKEKVFCFNSLDRCTRMSYTFWSATSFTRHRVRLWPSVCFFHRSRQKNCCLWWALCWSAIVFFFELALVMKSQWFRFLLLLAKKGLNFLDSVYVFFALRRF
jgi:Serpin (serine protease inhibitor)